jgi:hypothetical protein
MIEALKYAEAIQRLVPKAEFVVRDGVMEWLDERPQPSENEIADEIVRGEYIANRANAYPTILEQLDLLYHQGYEGWRTAIDGVKTQYPKPETAEPLA